MLKALKQGKKVSPVKKSEATLKPNSKRPSSKQKSRASSSSVKSSKTKKAGKLYDS